MWNFRAQYENIWALIFARFSFSLILFWSARRWQEHQILWNLHLKKQNSVKLSPLTEVTSASTVSSIRFHIFWPSCSGVSSQKGNILSTVLKNCDDAPFTYSVNTGGNAPTAIYTDLKTGMPPAMDFAKFHSWLQDMAVTDPRFTVTWQTIVIRRWLVTHKIHFAASFLYRLCRLHYVKKHNAICIICVCFSWDSTRAVHRRGKNSLKSVVLLRYIIIN